MEHPVYSSCECSWLIESVYFCITVASGSSGFVRHPQNVHHYKSPLYRERHKLKSTIGQLKLSTIKRDSTITRDTITRGDCNKFYFTSVST